MLIQKLKISNDEDKEEVEKELEETEKSISELTAEENRNKVMEQLIKEKKKSSLRIKKACHLQRKTWKENW